MGSDTKLKLFLRLSNISRFISNDIYFEKKGNSKDLCKEERTLNRIISGLHSSINT